MKSKQSDNPTPFCLSSHVYYLTRYHTSTTITRVELKVKFKFSLCLVGVCHTVYNGCYIKTTVLHRRFHCVTTSYPWRPHVTVVNRPATFIKARKEGHSPDVGNIQQTTQKIQHKVSAYEWEVICLWRVIGKVVQVEGPVDRGGKTTIIVHSHILCGMQQRH